MTAAQPQLSIAMTTQQPQPVFVVPSSFQRKPQETSSSLKVIRGLAISEMVLGSLCVVLEIIQFTLVGERSGIWCGTWIVAAGRDGIQASKRKFNECLMSEHLVFTVIGALLAITNVGINLSLIAEQHSAVGVAVIVISFSSAVILIVNASYCCYILPECCQHPKLAFAVPSSFQSKPEETSSSLKVIRGLAIVELLLGSLCVVLEIIEVRLLGGRYGMWFGTWVVVAGILAILALKRKFNECLVTSHVYFTLCGVLYAIINIGIYLSSIAEQHSAVSVAIIVISFSSAVILMYNACLSSYAMIEYCQLDEDGEIHLLSVSDNLQQPGMIRHPGASGIQGYPVQGYQPVFVQPGTAPPPQYAAQTKEQEALASQGNQPLDLPPPYSPT